MSGVQFTTKQVQLLNNLMDKMKKEQGSGQLRYLNEKYY